MTDRFTAEEQEPEIVLDTEQDNENKKGKGTTQKNVPQRDVTA